LLLSNRCPWIAAIVIINIIAIGSGGGIIAIAVAITVAIAISTIAIIAVIIDIALSMLLCCCCQNVGGATFLGTYLTYSYVGNLARPLVICGNEFLVITIPLTGSQQTQNLTINHWWKRVKTKGGATTNADNHGNTLGVASTYGNL
jgi:hypothetical protein